MKVHYRNFAEEVAGASELFAILRSRGIKVALTTGFPRQIADVIIEELGWAHRIDLSVCSDEVERGRPSPDMILKVAQEFDIDPYDTIKVGDTFSDMKAGFEAGCSVVLGTIYGTDGDGLTEQADGIIHSLADVLEYI